MIGQSGVVGNAGKFGESVYPSFAKEGWTRPKRKAAKHPLKGADGVVVSSYRLFIPNDFDNRWLETTNPYCCALSGLRASRARLRQLRNESISFMAQPPLLREGGVYPCPFRLG